jgi:hypothetical protein
MADQFETFLSFSDSELAVIIAEKLKDKNVHFLVERSKPLLDTSMVDTSINQNIHVKLQRQDFERAHIILEDYYKGQLGNIDKDYYLFSFSNDELKDIISKPDEWGHFDYQLAQKLLKERGDEISEETITKMKSQRMKQLAEPEKASGLLIFFGYCFIPFGIIVGYIIGRHLFYSTRTLPNGQMVFTYQDSDRKHGNRIIIIAGIFFMVSIVFWAIVAIRDN